MITIKKGVKSKLNTKLVLHTFNTFDFDTFFNTFDTF